MPSPEAAIALAAVTGALDGGALCLYDAMGVEMVRLPFPSPAFELRPDGTAEARRIVPVIASRAGTPVAYVAEAADGSVVRSGSVADDMTIDRPLEIGGLVKVGSLTYRGE